MGKPIDKKEYIEMLKKRYTKEAVSIAEEFINSNNFKEIGDGLKVGNDFAYGDAADVVVDTTNAKIDINEVGTDEQDKN